MNPGVNEPFGGLVIICAMILHSLHGETMVTTVREL